MFETMNSQVRSGLCAVRPETSQLMNWHDQSALKPATSAAITPGQGPSS